MPRGDFDPTRAAAPWFALRTMPRHEKATAQVLRDRGYEEFLPCCKARRRWSDRFKTVEMPLFPGYLFCRMNPQNRAPILNIPGVLGVVGFGRVPAPVDEGEIAALQVIVKSELAAHPWPFLKAGQFVQIEYGPLSGLEGILLSLKKEHRLVVSVTLLQRSVAVEVECDWVRPETGDRRSRPQPRQ
ncbi:MAG: UpxY family transcription antiterminator [Acidobacteriota bacterium]